MAEDYSSQAAFPFAQRFALSGTADKVTEIKLPKDGRKLTVIFETNAGKFTHTGTDDTAIGTEFFTVPADSAFEVVYGMGVSAADPLSVYVGSGTASTNVCVLLEGKVDLEDRN